MMKAADVSVPGGRSKKGLLYAGVSPSQLLPMGPISIVRFPWGEAADSFLGTVSARAAKGSGSAAHGSVYRSVSPGGLCNAAG